MQQLMNRFAFSRQDGDAFSERVNALFLQLQHLYETHADPAGAAGQAFAKAWWAMVTEFTGDNKPLLQTLMATGEDMDNWPVEAEVMRESIRNFLSAALDIYFRNNSIHTEWEDDRDG
ncbi:MAG: TipAS antibiotic-recognition domain-containing protein [Sporolactobacillus sp.]